MLLAQFIEVARRRNGCRRTYHQKDYN